MTTETTNLIVLTEAQAEYLRKLSSSSHDYKQSWQSLAERGQEETDRLNLGQWVSGPNHQVMAEVQQEYGRVKVLLDMIWCVFSVEDWDNEDREQGVKEVSEFIKIACGEPTKKHGAIAGGTWFSKGKTVNDYK
jgi:hypothetical protein